MPQKLLTNVTCHIVKPFTTRIMNFYNLMMHHIPYWFRMTLGSCDIAAIKFLAPFLTGSKLSHPNNISNKQCWLVRLIRTCSHGPTCNVTIPGLTIAISALTFYLEGARKCKIQNTRDFPTKISYINPGISITVSLVSTLVPLASFENSYQRYP